MSAIITAARLRARLDAGEAVTLIEVRNDKDPSAPRREWLTARIPGAVCFDTATELSSPARADGVGGRSPMPTPRAFIAGLNRCGARRDRSLVVYDGQMEGVAARFWWVARALGIPVQVLEGGFDAWCADGGPVETGEPMTLPAPGDLALPHDVDPDLPVGSDGRGTVRAEELLGPSPAVQVVDVRAPSRFRGDVEPNDRFAGHIPGAINVPKADDDGRPPSPELFASLLRHPGEIAASCGTGVSACLLLLRLAEAGRDDAKLYPGSWSEWCALGLPVATGSE
jgi:thiosulfate/3-mercaptopyruvate sulfurtransferase